MFFVTELGLLVMGGLVLQCRLCLRETQKSYSLDARPFTLFGGREKIFEKAVNQEDKLSSRRNAETVIQRKPGPKSLPDSKL
jgi:hypothetical protein